MLKILSLRIFWWPNHSPNKIRSVEIRSPNNHTVTKAYKAPKAPDLEMKLQVYHWYFHTFNENRVKPSIGCGNTLSAVR
jgi:hypothetical protein